MGCKEWQDDIPKTSQVLAIVALIINIFFAPGIGTILASLVHEEGGGMRQCTLIIGIIQFFTAGCLIGWIWAIWWSFLIFQKAK